MVAHAPAPAPDPLRAARSCELHVHIGGCISVDDLIELGAPHADRIDWSLYVRAHEQAFGVRPDPATWLRAAGAGDEKAVEAIRRHYVYTEADGADFSRFMGKFNLAICVLRHHHGLGSYDDCVARTVDGHRRQGIGYVEMRAMAPPGPEDPDGFLSFHRRNARVIAAACEPGFTARYVPSIPRWDPLVAYSLLAHWLKEDDEAAETVCGFDFCHFEEGFPPGTTRDFFRRWRLDEADRGGAPRDVLYHVGEIYFDKSLESAVRWCHEAALLGARRLGHCIALGLDPALAVTRRDDAHVLEPVTERMAQIDYDLTHRKGLEDAGVDVDVRSLETEREALRSARPHDTRRRPYDEQRLEQIRRRQDYVLAELAREGTVIESCPSSNMRLGSVPATAAHPVHRFLDSDVPLVIGADDPGIFDSPLSAEIDWVVDATRHSARNQSPLYQSQAQLARRLGNPARYRCGAPPIEGE